jgi:hypothetical protein
VDYPETVVFTKDAILPVEIIVLRSPSKQYCSDSTFSALITYWAAAPAVDLYARFTKKLTNVSTAGERKKLFNTVSRLLGRISRLE